MVRFYRGTGFALKASNERRPGWGTQVRGKRFSPSIDVDDFNQVNDWLYEQNLDRPLEDVLAGATCTYDRFRTLIASVSDDFLFDPANDPKDERSYGEAMVSGEFFSQLPDEHISDIEAWLATLGKSLPAR